MGNKRVYTSTPRLGYTQSLGLHTQPRSTVYRVYTQCLGLHKHTLSSLPQVTAAAWTYNLHLKHPHNDTLPTCLAIPHHVAVSPPWSSPCLEL